MKAMNKTLLVTMAVGVLAQSVQADNLLFETDRALQFNSPQIDIEGDPIKRQRMHMEQKTNEMVRQRIENQRLQQERELTRSLQKAFTQGLEARDEVSTIMAAPQPAAPAVVEAPAPVARKSDEPTNKILPHFGVTNIKGEAIDFETKINMGVTFESMLTENISVGVGLGYTAMDITDFANTYVTQPMNNFNTFNTWYPHNGYNNLFGQGRTIDYKNMSMLINSKFFLSTSSKIRPFVGAALSYNRAKLQYQDNGNNFSFQGTSFGNEGYSSSYIGATGLLGSEVVFTDTIGMSLDFRYARGLTSGFSTNSDVDPTRNFDQRRLENISNAIEKADFFSLNLGLLVRF
jgi:outer membrane protein W